MSAVQAPFATAAPAAAGGVAEFINATRHLPLFPGMAAQLVRSVEREDISASELGSQIATDATLASHLLRLVNSSFYGLSRRIGTVPDALAVLGFNLVRRVVTSVVLHRPVRQHLPDTPAAHAFWRNQLLTAALARLLHQRNGQEGEELAYMAGLLHDLGRLAMFARWPVEYADLLLSPQDDDGSGQQPLAEERRRFGFDHAVAGGALLQLWGVPDTIALAAASHHDDCAPDDAVGASVWQASQLVHQLASKPELGGDPAWLKDSGLDAAVLRKLLDEVNAMASGRA